MRKDITIWQFVRIMVEAENNPNGKVLLDSWAELWAEIDGKLSDLLEQDTEETLSEYASLMMDSQIILEDMNREKADCVMEMVGNVVERIRDTLDTIEQDESLSDEDADALADDLVFEIQGLEELVDELAGK